MRVKLRVRVCHGLVINWRTCSSINTFSPRGWSDGRVPGRTGSPATDERTRSCGRGQDPVRKSDKVHRVSRRCEVATLLSPGAQLAHHRSMCRGRLVAAERVRLRERKLRQLVQIQIPEGPGGISRGRAVQDGVWQRSPSRLQYRTVQESWKGLDTLHVSERTWSLKYNVLGLLDILMNVSNIFF